MKKVKYETPVVEVIEFDAEDMIVASPLSDDDEVYWGLEFGDDY